MRWTIGLYLVFCIGPGWAQRLEVASLKPSRAAQGTSEGQLRAQDMMAENMPAGFVPVKGATVSAHDRTLAQLVAMAFKVKPSSVTGPNWISDLRYDIDAKLPEDAPAKEANAMLQHLLEERFALRTHTETKKTGGYALVVAKDGPKLTPAAEPGPPLDKEERQRRAQEYMRQQMDRLAKSGRRGFSSWGASQATSTQIAESVARMIKSPVVDETGLTGKYAVNIEMLPGDSPDDSVEYRMSLALSKLGLKLESRKTDVTTLVVDSAAKTPEEN